MSDYTITTNFGAKDSLPSGNAGKVIKGSEFTTEFTSIQTAIATKADIAGSANISVDRGGSSVYLTLTGANPEIILNDSTNTNTCSIQNTDGTLNYHADENNEFHLSRHRFYTDGTQRMEIEANGNVGIGTTSPTEKLHVSDSSDFLVDVSGNDSAVVFKESGGNSWRIGNDSSTDAFVVSQSESSLGTDVKLFIDSTGKLLLNTSTHTLTDSEMVVASEYSASGTTTGGITLSSRQSGSWRNSGIFANGSDLTFTTGDTGLNGAQASSERMRIDSSGNVGIGTDSPTEKLDIDGDSIRLRQSQTPASASATGTQGQIAWDANYMYVCTATNTWKRVALATWS